MQQRIALKLNLFLYHTGTQTYLKEGIESLLELPRVPVIEVPQAMDNEPDMQRKERIGREKYLSIQSKCCRQKLKLTSD